MKLSKYGFNVALVLLLVPGIAHAENPDLMTLIGASSAGDDYATRDNSGNDINDNASTYGLSSSDHNSFAVDYGNSGVIRGHGRCSTRAGTNPWNNDTYETISGNFVETLTDETGQNGAQYCYCHLDSYTASGGSSESLSGPWVFVDGNMDAADCADVCAYFCARSLMRVSALNLAFRAAVFNAYAPTGGASSTITTQTYVDNALAGKQAKITTTGTNKLMTYGSSAGATPGSRDIVSTLGTSTSATTVPETGPIVAGMNSKQKAVNGTANYVMTGTGTAGRLGEKPVYSATNNYSNALVTAQTINTAAMDAANGEMSCHSYVSGQSETPENCLLWAINQSAPSGLSTATLVTSVNGTSYCGRTLDGVAHSSNGTCGADTLSYLGELDSKNGKWGAVFPYGDVSGISVCSNINGGTIGTVATDEQTTTLNSQYTSQANGGSVAGQYCWCKMENPVASRWVFKQSGRSANECKNNCPNNCASSGSPSGLVRNESFRIAVFGALE
jgi:hypothetical protein